MPLTDIVIRTAKPKEKSHKDGRLRRTVFGSESKRLEVVAFALCSWPMHGGRFALEALLIAIIQFILEFALEVISYSGIDWPRSRKGTEPESLAGVCFTWLVVGCFLAWLSVLVFKHTFIRAPELRIANLVLAPIVSACISQSLAKRRGRNIAGIIPRNHFWQAFWFTFGLVIVRFAYAAPS